MQSAEYRDSDRADPQAEWNGVVQVRQWDSRTEVHRQSGEGHAETGRGTSRGGRRIEGS